MKKILTVTYVTIGFVILLILIGCGLFILYWSTPFLLPSSKREPPIILSNLLLTSDYFPSGWKADGFPEPEPEQFELDWGEENLFIGFQPTGYEGYATHYIYKFRNKAAAKYGLLMIKQQGLLTPYSSETPIGWSYRSPIANDWLFGCIDSKGCTALARYDEFISVFRTNTDSKYMTSDDLETILKAIDKKMNRYLELNPR